ncbi:MFS family permease [Streptococcus rupicaprae]|uniref:MFS family permease n=1 Tax=Streptococcus rupicaprae TaxID=759619 RepID=A0ABV2FHB8_9STRE
MKKILTNKLFMGTFASDLISNLGDTLYYLALMTYVLSLPDARFAIAAVSLSEILPMFLALPIGLKADKTREKLPAIFLTLVVRIILYAGLGLLMGFEPALWIVLVACVINLISDLAGQYENGLFGPITLRILEEEEREPAMAFKQTVRSISGLGFQLLGAILITLLTYQELAFVNAGTFALSAVILVILRPSLQGLLNQEPIQISTSSEDLSASNPLVELFKNARFAFVELMKIPGLRMTMLVIPALNAVLSVLETLLLLSMKEYPHMIIGNVATTLMLMTISILVGQVLGGMLAMGPMRQVAIAKIIFFASVTPVLIFLAFLAQSTGLVMLSLCLAALGGGLATPKLQALILNHMPEERLATVGAAIDSYFTAGILIARVGTAAAVVLISVSQLASVYLVLSLALFACSLVRLGKTCYTKQDKES